MSFIDKILNNTEQVKDINVDLPATHLEYPKVMIHELLEESAKKYPNHTAVEYFGKGISYKEFYKKVEISAKALKKLDIKKGDRITICMPNTPEALIFFYSINMIGASASMIHPLSSVNEIEYYLEVANSKYVLTVDMFADKVVEAARKIDAKKVIIANINTSMRTYMKVALNIYNFVNNKINKKDTTLPTGEDILTWDEFFEMGKYENTKFKYKGDCNEEAVILYSGGTTGKPKGIRLSNMNFNALGMQCYNATGAAPGDSVLVVMPIFHGFGLGVSIHTLLISGMNCVLVPQFKATEFVRLIKKYKPVFLAGVPTMYEALSEQKENSNYLACVKNCICGGDLLTPSLKDKINQYLAEHGSTAQVRVGYGLSEATAACILTPNRYYQENGIGLPLPDNEVKIIKPGTTKELKANKIGEICVSGPTIMLGYLNEVEENKDTLKVHEDGKTWLHTGDLGYKDEKGYIFFKSRLKRMIVTSGYNVYPSYMEKIIVSHPAVKNCVVVGIPHPYKKQVPVACIVLEDNYEGNSNMTESIKTYCEESIAKYSMPYRYHYIKSVPKTLLGKINYKKLEEECRKKYEKKS